MKNGEFDKDGAKYPEKFGCDSKLEWMEFLY